MNGVVFSKKNDYLFTINDIRFFIIVVKIYYKMYLGNRNCQDYDHIRNKILCIILLNFALLYFRANRKTIKISVFRLS